MKRFPGVPMNEFGNGVYAIDQASREQWESIEEFPPYELDLEAGEALFTKSFKNGKSFADCFPNWEKGVRQDYPMYDADKDTIRTLEGDINACLTANGEKPYKWNKGKIAQVSGFLAYNSRGNKLAVKTPSSPAAISWYERGKRHFYSKRGQLNLSCANCHADSSGMKVRADLLSPALGHVSHFPVYRSKWGGMGTLHRRYGGCNKQVRAKPFKPQSDEYKALEYFHTYMSSGIEVNGPGARK
jgi:sulfur-oxidizing protein SoxA